MEYHLASSQSHLLSSLDFSLSPSSGYILSRRTAYNYTTGASGFSPSGVNVARIVINGNEWLDLSTLKFHFVMAGQLRPNSSEFSDAIDRVRVFANSSLLEDLMNYSRMAQVFKHLTPAAVNKMRSVEQFGVIANPTDATHQGTNAIAQGRIATIIWRPYCSGLYQSGKVIPLRFCPLSWEISITPRGSDLSLQDPSWSISSVYCTADYLTLESSLEGSFYSLLLKNKSLVISFQSVHTVQSSLTSSNTSISVTRAFTRLAKCFVTFAMLGLATPSPPSDMRFINTDHTDTQTFSDYIAGGWQFSIGGRQFPERKVESISHTWAQLMQAAGLSGRDLQTIDINGEDYMAHSYIIGQTFENVPNTAFSGISTRSGSLVRLTLKKLVLSQVDTCFVFLVHDVILEVSERACTVYT
jgi:hypothetical protein